MRGKGEGGGTGRGREGFGGRGVAGRAIRGIVGRGRRGGSECRWSRIGFRSRRDKRGIGRRGWGEGSTRGVRRGRLWLKRGFNCRRRRRRGCKRGYRTRRRRFRRGKLWLKGFK
jgi:hypothetical protein